MFKKIICLVLIVGLLPVIFVFANEPKTSYINDETQILKAEGHPNGELTRAEFSVILCRIMGVEKLAKSPEMIVKEYFSDVPKTHWAAGYINTAVEYKVINGFEDFTFRPELTVTNEQVVNMLVAAWEYAEETERLGGYPDGYIEYNEPKSEATDYIHDPVSILKKVTPENAKYERTMYEQLVPAEFMPFTIRENILTFDDNTEYTGDRKINVYISEQGVKQPFVDEYFAQNSFDLSFFSIPAGDWQCQFSITDGAVRDTYFTMIRKYENNTLEFTGDIFRYTVLNAQPSIIEEKNDLTVSGIQGNDLYPFAILPLIDENLTLAISVSYLPVVPNDHRFMLSMNSMDLYFPPFRAQDGSDISDMYSNCIQGKNEVVSPVIFYDLQFDTDYHLQASVTNEYGDGVSLKGNIILFEKNGNIDYIFEGVVRTIEIKGYEIIRYDFDTVEFMPDSGSGLGDSALTQDGEMIFEPFDITNSWLADFAGGSALRVSVGMLNFGNGTVLERYIDITGANGEIRLLQNSGAAQEGYDKTLFWSAKQQSGTSVIKDFNGEIKCAVLFEFPDGSCYLYGYIEGDGTDFWQLELPMANYYRHIKYY